jgi:hypothetical protein
MPTAGLFAPGIFTTHLSGAGSPQDEVYLPTDDDAPAGMRMFDAVGPDPVARHFGASYSLLERVRPDVASLARFAHRVEIATFHMCAAFDHAGVRGFEIDLERSFTRRRGGTTWFTWLADTTFCRFRTLRRALTFEWTPPAEVEPLTYSAFHSLCDLTPASGHHLKQLFFSRRPKAIEALVGQLDLIAKLLEEAVELAADTEHVLSDRSAGEAAARLASSQAEILGRAGEALGLREAARRLGMSHQNLHKRIGAGSALGVMRGRELVVPSIQFVSSGDAEKIVPNLRQVLRPFEEARAGVWSALQFLVEQDPALGAIPIELLKQGDVTAVVAAARAFLGLDEG